MKALFLFIALFVFGQSACACLSAQQTRIFPIGKCDRGLILLEAKLFRRTKKGTKEHEMIPAWQGKCYLNIYDAEQKIVHSEIIDSNIYLVGESYIEDLIPTLEKAKEIVAIKFSIGFIPAEFQSVQFADYELSIKGAALIKDTIGLTVSLQLDQGSVADLNLFDTKLKSVQSYVETYLKWYYELEREMQVAVINGMKIGSVRTFLIGEEVFQLYHLGSGEKIQPWEEGKKREIPVVKVEGQLYDEPVLHHGQGFDYLIWL